MQLTERIFVKENSAMYKLCLRQTLVYNQALWVFQTQHFGWEHLNVTWREYYTKPAKWKRNDGDKEKKPRKGARIVERIRWMHQHGTWTKQAQDGKKPVTWMISYYDVRNMMRWLTIYRDASSIAANTVQRANDAIKGYYAHLKEWAENGVNDTGKPKLPRYIERGKKAVAMFTYGQFKIEDHYVIFNEGMFKNAKLVMITPVHVPRMPNQTLRERFVQQLRIVPCKGGGYWVECVHEVESLSEVNEKCKKLGCWNCTAFRDCFPDTGNEKILGIDLNLNRVVMMVFSDVVEQNKPVGFSGGPIKSINQIWNKEIARLQADQARHNPRLVELQQKKHAGEKLTKNEWIEWRQLTCRTKKMNVLTDNRNNRVKAFFHRLSRIIVNLAIDYKIDIIVIGHNKLQKQEINLGDRTNQNFVQIPVFNFIKMLLYKSQLVGISLIEIPEDYTTQSSFYDADPLPTIEQMKLNPVQFSGTRLNKDHRYKLYKTKNGKIINGDVNDAYNILRKAFPNAVSNVIADDRLHPEIRIIPAS